MSPLKDGLIEDWDLFEKLVDHSYKRHIRSDSELHPVLVSEAPVGADFYFLVLKQNLKKLPVANLRTYISLYTFNTPLSYPWIENITFQSIL